MSRDLTDINVTFARETRSRPHVDYKALNSVGRMATNTKHGDSTGLRAESLESSPVVDPTEHRFREQEEKRRRELDQETIDCGEFAALQQHMKRLEAQEAELSEMSELEMLRRKVLDKEMRVGGLQDSIIRMRKESTSVAKGLEGEGVRRKKDEDESRKRKKDKKGSRASGGGMLIDINSLRKMAPLKGKVLAEMSKLGLIDNEEGGDSEASVSVADSDSSESSESSDTDKNADKCGSKKSRKSRKNARKSGIESKISDDVVNKQKFPQAHLRFDFASQHLSFSQLDLNLLVAGELEIISACRDKKEKNGRIDLLKSLMYLAKSHDISVIRSLYAAVLREIEIGIKNWGDDFSYVESAILSKQKSQGKSGAVRFGDGKYKAQPANLPEDKAESMWFCSKYQRNKCPHKSAHSLVVNGKMRYAKHICASCWLKDHKSLDHPECSSACPHTSD